MNTFLRKYLVLFVCLWCTVSSYAQLNTERITAIGRNALYFEDYVLSIQYFNQVIRLKPWLAEPYLYRAIAKIQLGDYKGAEDDCNKAIENNPFLPGAYYARGYVYGATGEFRKAEDDFSEALVYAPENKTYLLLRADARAKNKEYDAALSDIDYLLKRDPASPSLFFEKGAICMEKNDTLCAMESFTNAIKGDSQNSANWSARGVVNMMLGNNEDALYDLSQAINLGSRWSGDYVNRGILYYHKHNYRDALADYDKAVEYDPSSVQCYYNRGILRAELGDLNRALDDLNRAVELDSSETEIYYQRGIVNLHLKQWQSAVSDFVRLMDRYPYFLPAYYLAAQAEKALGNEKEAYRYQKKAYDLEQQKDEIQHAQASPDVDVKQAESQPQRNRRKEFSQVAAQNMSDEQEERQQAYQNESRGSVQKRYANAINEPNVVLGYYIRHNSLRHTNFTHSAVEAYNKKHLLPAALALGVQEIPLTAESVESHFRMIGSQSSELDLDPVNIDILFARAIEFAVVQDYSSAIDDCNKVLQLRSDFALAYFCRANWRYNVLEYKRNNTRETAIKEQQEELLMSVKLDYELIMRDLDQVILLLPNFSFAYYNKANLLCLQKDFRSAIEYYTSAVSIDPDFAEAYFNRGLTRIFIDEVESGLSDLSKAGELGIYQAYNLITRFQ